jgi:hypothetical protein
MRTGETMGSGNDGIGISAVACLVARRRPVATLGALALCLFLLFCCLPNAGRAAPVRSDGTPTTPQLRHAAKSARGKLRLRLVGLPRGERGSVLLLGPRHTRRHLSLGRARMLALPVGTYSLKVAKVALRRGDGTVRRGAVAEPVRKTLHAKVRSARTTKLQVTYGTILNPGTRSVTGHVVGVVGDPQNPTEVIVSGVGGLEPGQVLSAEPGPRLPHGLLAKVEKVSHVGGHLAVRLRPASIYEVAPNISFEIPLVASEGMELLKLADCKAAELVPSAELSDFSLNGSWTTAHVLFADVKTGATVELHYRVSAGVKVSAGEGLSCSLSLKEFGFQGMAGPIPVYGGIRPTASAELAAAASLGAKGSVEVTTGTKIGVLPPGASPIVRFSSPHFEFTATAFAGLKASIGLDAELGIGAEDAANIHADLGNSLDFTAAPGECDWELSLGKLSATGEIGKFKISTPETHALYHHSLWHAGCGAPAPPPAPTPTPAPAPAPAPPPITVPAVGPTLVYTGGSGLSPFDGDFEFEDWSTATGQPALVEESLPTSLTPYRCVALLVNRSFSTAQEQELAGYLQDGGTVFAIGEHESEFETEGPGFDEADEALNGLAGSLGVGLSLNEDSWDEGELLTEYIDPSPLTVGVTQVGDDWVSSLTVSGSAKPLVETSDGLAPYIGYQQVGNGIFVMSGDSNGFTDNNQESFEFQDNGRLVANICP